MSEEPDFSLAKRGHRSSSIPNAFWEAAKLSPPLHTAVKRGRVFPLLITCAGEDPNTSAFRILSEYESPLQHPVAMRQITVLDSQMVWTQEEAKQLLVNEASLSLRKVIVNRHNLHNPIRQWDDASWYYTWVEDSQGNSHCVIIPMVAIPVRDIPLQKPDRHKWRPLASALKAHIMLSADSGCLLPFPEALMVYLKSLIGDHLFEDDPSPPRPDLKKNKQGSFDFRDSHPLGCGDTSDEERRVQHELSKIPNFQAE